MIMLAKQPDIVQIWALELERAEFSFNISESMFPHKQVKNTTTA